MIPPGDAPASDLRHYLRVVRRRKWTIVLATVAATGAALAASLLQTPVYRATAKVLLQGRSTEALFDAASGPRSGAQVDTEIQVLESAPVRALVAERLGAAPDASAAAVGQTEVMEVSAESADPERAAAVADAYAGAYIEHRRALAIADLQAAIETIAAKVNDLQGQIARLDADIATLSPAARDDPNARRAALVQQQSLFAQQIDRLQLGAGLSTGGAQLINPASAPDDPVRPTPGRNGAVAAGAGLLAGAALAFVFDHLDDAVRSRDDLEQVAPGLPVLGLIPVTAGWRRKRRPVVASLARPASQAAEAYRALRTSVQFSALDRPLRSLAITSPGAREGKTTTVANLGVALARAGQRVLIADCDLRRPRVHDFFGLSNRVGLTSVLLGEVTLPDAVQPAGEDGRLMLLATGPLPPNPSELLSSPRAAELLAALEVEADIVLVDTPPVLPVTDASVLASRVDGVLLVVSAGHTGAREADHALELLRQVDAPLAGTVLNGVPGDRTYYGYRYQYHYAEEDGRRSHPRRRRHLARRG